MSLFSWIDDNIIQPVVKNPVAVLVNVGLMSVGVPPIYAAAAGAAANTAVKGGSINDIVKSGVTGGIMAYAGGAASKYLTNAGYGSIVAGAGGGAASAATGAALTGGDLVKALQSGLVMGGVVGGVAQLMTPTEAIAKVEPKQLADLYSKGTADPLGDLIKQQGWTDSDSARAAASQAFSKNSATTMTQLRDSIPDYVLANAQAAVKANPAVDVGQYVSNELGWQFNNYTGSAINQEFGNYVAANKVIGGPVAPTQSATVTPTGAAAEGSLMTRAQYAESIPDNVLAEAIKTSDPVGYVNKAMGYPGQGLAAGGVNDALASYRMASTPAVQPAVTAPVIPADINTALSIANAPGVVDPLGTLIQQMQWTPAATAGLTASVADAYAQKTAAQLAGERLSNLSKQQQTNINTRVPGLMTEATNNANIDSILSQSPDVSTLMKKLGWSDNQFTQEASQRLLDNYKAETYATNQLVNQQLDANGNIDLGPPSPSVAEMTTQQVNDAIKNGTIPPTTVAPVNPNLVDIGGGNFMDSAGNITDANGNITRPAVVPGPAAPPIAGDIKVDVGGTPAYSDNPNSAIQQYRTPNTNLATSAQIDNGTASWNAAANAWEIPITNQPLSELTPGSVDSSTGPGRQVTTVEVQSPKIPISSEQVNMGDYSYIFTKFSDGSFTQQPVQTVTQPPVTQPPVVQPPVTQPPVVQPPVTQPSVTVPGQTTDGTVVVPGTREPIVPVIPPTVTQPVVTQPVVTPPVVIPPTVTVPGQTDDGTIIVKGDREVDVPVIPPVVTEPPVTKPVSPGGTDTPDTKVTNPPPVVVIPPETPTPTKPTTRPGTYKWGDAPVLNIPTGLNPGWIQPTDFYKTTDPVQSHYYWGGHPYQPGPTFNPALYNSSPGAPGTPWGLQQMFNPNYNYPVTQYMPPQQYLPVAP